MKCSGDTSDSGRDFEKLQKERAERDKNSVPIIMNEKSAPLFIEKKKGK